ncbi:hypothetical protein ACW18Q_07445 [Limosilactobacillus reuteri]
MMKKLKSNWQAIALTVVVLLSLFISWIVWTNPFPFEEHDTKISIITNHNNIHRNQGAMFISQLKQLRQMKRN